MQYKIEKGTKLFDKFSELKKKIDDVNSASGLIAKEFGTTKICNRQGVAFGGISAFELNDKPEGWKHVGKPWRRLYFPKVALKDINKRISELPVIEYDEINELVNFKGPQAVPSDGIGIGWVRSIGFQWGKDCVLVEVNSGCKYEPLPEMVEILESEFIKLKNHD